MLSEVSIFTAFAHDMLHRDISICVAIIAHVPHCPTLHFVGLSQPGMTNSQSSQRLFLASRERQIISLPLKSRTDDDG